MLVAVGAAGGGAALAVASVPDSGGVIHACVKVATLPASGATVPYSSGPNLRIIDPNANQQCNPVGAPPTETALNWNVTGPQGAPGAPGAPGRTLTVANGHTLTISGGQVITVGGGSGLTLAPPLIKGNDRSIGQAVFGSGRGALTFHVLGLEFAVAGKGSTGSAAGKASFHDISITKLLDKSTAKLSQACGSGQHFKQVTITLGKSGGGKVKFIEYKLKDVLISSVQVSSSGKGDHPPFESLSLSFAGLEIQHS